MDPYTERLVERTRQRREMLNQKLGKTPDPAPRKRVLEDTSNIQAKPPVPEDDSPKRQCLWESDGKGKPDTPAIVGVKSRLHSLTDQRMNWDDVSKADEEMKPSVLNYGETDAAPSSHVSRKSRFAQLAQHINAFEDDLSHPTIQKVEEKKPRWQPPRPEKENELLQKTVGDAKDRHVSSPKKEYESYQGPVRSPGPKNNHSANPPHSPKTRHAPEPPPAPAVPHLTSLYGPPKPPRAISPVRAPSPKKSPAPGAPTGSPKVSTYKLELQTPDRPQSPKFQHQVKQVVNMTPINARPAENNAQTDLEPTAKPVTERLASWKKTVDTPQKPKVDDPTDLPLSERFAGWEQRVSQTPTTDRATSSKVAPTPKLMCTTPGVAQETDKEDDPAAKPVSDRMSQWKQQDATVNPRREQEPTAYSVSDRMSAWEHMSSANKVSYIKKVDPSNSPRLSPSRVPAPPMAPKASGTPSKFGGFKPLGTPKKGLTPQKSFKESIEERAAQMGRRPPPSGEGLPPKPPATNQSPSRTGNTAAKSQPASSPSKMDKSSPSRPHSSPVRVGSATKTLQQRLIEQTQHSKTDQFAEKLRQERMAEVNALQNRYQNGILKENLQLSESEVTSVEDEPKPPPQPKFSAQEKREAIKAKAREDFNKKLAAMGFEISDSAATYNFQQNNQNTANQGSEVSSGEEQGPTVSSAGQRKPSSATKQPSSIYRLVSKKTSEAEKPVIQKNTSSTSLKKVTFEGLNTSAESEVSTGTAGTETDDETYDELENDQQPGEIQSETQESFDDSFETDNSSIPESYRGPAANQDIPVQQHKISDDYDDVSMSAFVPDSVRRESILPHQAYNDNTSLTSEDSFDYNHKSEYRPLSPQAMASGSSESEYQSRQGRKSYSDQSSSESEAENHTGEIDDLLDEAMDEVPEVEMRPKKVPVAVPRKRRSHMYATTEGELPIKDRCKSDGLAYSVSMYRTDRDSSFDTSKEVAYDATSSFGERYDRVNEQEHVPKQKILRNSHYTQQQVYEEDIRMPTQLPPDVQRQTIKERIKELQELVSQENSVIMQTSNALNQCCMGDSKFAGSVEQVECNRLLLVACQKRQAYLTEVQRLKETGQLDPPGQEGPKGSLTINDIRLPLKKEFVTKIGTASDTTVHYFIILIRNGPHIIFTQMLSTHDKNMRGSLDFPNLIKIHGISGKFSLVLEIYSMSVSRESLGKEKKKKTPKKPMKGFALPVESPGGPTAVRTTSFTLITTLPITMKLLDKNCFSLERIPFLSPLHGMIYMRLKCMMEQNVEERGFLTMFEDVSGLGAWHRRWCVLTGNKLGFWKYPDDETRKDPIGFVDLKRCITEKAGLMPRDICARPNTFELVAVRPPRKGEQDTLVTKTYSTMTTTRYQLSADTKEERIVWCNKINRALANIRTWHADAMRPVRPK